MFSPFFQAVFLALMALLAAGATLRWRRTAPYDPEYTARGDMARLMGVFVVAQAVVLARSFLKPASTGFWVCSALLLPVVIAVVALLRRLFAAYREKE